MGTGYSRWLHTGFPSGTVEAWPEVESDGTTRVPGLYVAGDLLGTPLLKLAADSGARIVERIQAELTNRAAPTDAPAALVDLLIVGAGVAGLSAALTARRLGLHFRWIEAHKPLSTLVDFPARKPIFTYPKDLSPHGGLRLGATVKEDLLAELEAQRQAAGLEPEVARLTGVERQASWLHGVTADGARLPARAVLLAIGRAGEHRRLGVPGEDGPEVYYRLHDPRDFAGRAVVVVGGGDSAVESACALAEAEARVTLVHRGADLARAKAENQTRLESLRGAGRLTVRLGTTVQRIEPGAVEVSGAEASESLAADALFVHLGRSAPLALLAACGIPARGRLTPQRLAAFAAFLLAVSLVGFWKGATPLNAWFAARGLFPFNITAESFAGWGSFGKALGITLREPGFYYSAAYTAVLAAFGVRRIHKRRTPYVTLQTSTLIAVQVVPLFLLPYFVLPWATHAGWFDAGVGATLADALFPRCDYGHGRELWRSFGFILAWPLFLWNVFTNQPLAVWLGISFVQTFVVIPLIVWRWGKGAYCGWICSCGGLAETLGDDFRRAMPHGPGWNRLNMLGQVILAISLGLFVLRLVGWIAPHTSVGALATWVFWGLTTSWAPLSYSFLVDLVLSGIIGIGFYFWFSGRVWCRFACPLAALMHIYARFSRFVIAADKAKCISCGVCTSVCHQGIDVMAFAIRGKPMDDPQCVRCSACVGECPTGVLAFARRDAGGSVVAFDTLVASAVRARHGGSAEVVSHG